MLVTIFGIANHVGHNFYRVVEIDTNCWYCSPTIIRNNDYMFSSYFEPFYISYSPLKKKWTVYNEWHPESGVSEHLIEDAIEAIKPFI